MNHWLMKSEPATYSIADLRRDGTTLWDGVRNFQARNFLRAMRPGDLAFFYHSNVPLPGIVGRMEVAAADVVDPTQFDPASPYFDARAARDAPRWWTVRVRYRETFAAPLTLPWLRERIAVTDLLLLRPGNRLSVMPVPAAVAEALVEAAATR